MTPKQIKTLARRVLNKEVFGTWEIQPEDAGVYEHLIFLPIALGAEPPAGFVAAFAPYADRIQTNANPGGYPCFSSVQFICEDDYTKLAKILVTAIETTKEDE